jgi:opacity protein-like surface antigen
MKTLITQGVFLGLAAATALPAAAQDVGSNPTGPYIGAALGLEYYGDDDVAELDPGGSLSLQLGYRFSDNWRAELEGGVTGIGVEGSDDDVLAIARGTISAYYDFLSSDNLLVPYVGAGVGIAGVGFDFDDVDDDDEDFESELTWHAEAGLSLNVSPHFAIVPAYRYTWTDNSEDVTEDSLRGHAFRLGARVSF